MGSLNEKQVVDSFTENLNKFSKLINEDNVRIYARELQIRTPDGEKKADLVLEIEDEKNTTPMANKMLVLEFKKGFIDNGAASQVRRYADVVGKQLYRHKPITSFIVGTDFSEHEIKMCRELKVFPLQYDSKTGFMKIK